MTATMKATIFEGKNQIALKAKPVPKPGYNEALVRITLTTLCGTDLHIVRGEYPVRIGLTIGHEPVGVIEEVGPGVTGYDRGTRVLIGAITPCGQCEFCLSGKWAQCGGRLGGWKFGNTIDGCQAEYVLVPNAQANLAIIPDTLSNEDVVLLADIASTGLSATETANVQLGDAVAVFAQGPIGLCATAGARLKGASTVIGIDSDRTRLKTAKAMGADEVIDYSAKDPVHEVMRITNGRGVDVAIEALGLQQTFESCLRVLRPGGKLSSLGVYSGKLEVPVDAYGAGIADIQILSTLCPGGKERMRRLMELVAGRRLNLRPLLTHDFSLDQIHRAYEVFGNRSDGVLKVAIRP
jgi:threonine dehydrogenase-like Zn-dependent dehydrogenase